MDMAADKEEVADRLEGGPRGKIGREENGAGAEQRSVYFVGDEGILSTEEISDMKVREEKHFINAKNMSQVKGTKEFNNVENVLVSEGIQIQSSKDLILENGSSSILPSKGYTENGITRTELEIKEDVHVKLVKKSKHEVAEIDLEKVLEEQDTHDLFCPNCNSCITKRVILRKRKRTVREIQCDAPPAKVQQLQLLDATAASAEATELGHDTEPDVFRCLSCFSFFIPTESGFNIFRIFGRRETENLRTSQQLSAKTVSWSSSIFKPVASTTRASEPGLPLLSEDAVDSVQQMAKTSTNIQTSPATTPMGAVSLGESQMTTAKSDADAGFNIFRIFGRRGATGNMPTSQHLLAKNVNSSSSILTEVSSPSRANESGVTLPVESNISFGGDSSFTIKQSSTTITVSGSAGLEGGQSTIGGKDTMPWDSFITNREPVVDQAKNSMLNYLAKAESEGIKYGQNDTGDDMIQPIRMIKPTFSEATSQFSESIHGSVESVPPGTVVSTHVETQIYLGESRAGEAGRRKDWDVLKSIVYGGLLESLTSLGVVSSAAGSDTSTLNIVALGLANMIGGLFVIAHDLSELKSIQEEAADKNGEPVGRYWQLLGRKANFRLHATIALLAYIVVGLMPPLIYGFSFRKSDNKEYKLIAVAATSLVCISLLAIGKAHIRPQKPYFKSLAYYLALGVSASGLSYVAGVMVNRLLDQLGLFDNSAAAYPPPLDMYHGITSTTLGAWASS